MHPPPADIAPCQVVNAEDLRHGLVRKPLWTVDTAAPTIDTLQKQGYTLVTVSQLLGSTKPGKLYPAA